VGDLAHVRVHQVRRLVAEPILAEGFFAPQRGVLDGPYLDIAEALDFDGLARVIPRAEA